MFRILIICLSLMALCTTFLANANELKKYHKDSGLTCDSCHVKGEKKQAPKPETCKQCHTSLNVIEEIDHNQEPNPHTSIHYGTDLPCTFCHKEHKKSVVYCNQCHQFEYKNMKR